MRTVKLIGAENLDELAQFALNEAALIVQNYLSELVIDESLLTVVNSSFGNRFDAEKLKNLRRQWADKNFEAVPTIELRPSAEINGANGAFSEETNRIYLSWEYIIQNASYPQAITNVLLEEIGHFVDAQINTSDSPGDEGAIFSALVRRETVDEGQLQQLKAEDDTTTITLDGQAIQIEQAGNDVEIYGSIVWYDSAGYPHPVREATVEVWDKETPFLADELVKTVSTNSNGFYLATFDNNDGFSEGNRDIYIKVLANGPAHYVENPNSKTSYFLSTQPIEVTSGGTHQINLPINLNNPAESTYNAALSISDALYVGEGYAKAIRNILLLLPKLKVNFFPIGGATNYDPKDKALNIVSRDRWDWDVILHEYGHFLADVDNLSGHVGGKHRAGSSSITGDSSNSHPIPARGKHVGVRVAWSEGLATYLGIAAQYVANDKGLLPNPNIPNVHNTIYNDTVDQTITHDLENKSRSGNTTNADNKGEGDEASVFRILWDIADNNKDLFSSGLKDELAFGHKGLYEILNDTSKLPNLNQLDNIWDYFYSISTDAKRTKFGAIFEEYGVSPEPKKSNLVGKTFKVKDTTTIPIFEWDAQNNNANDEFQVIVFNEDFSRRLIDKKSLNGTSWKPTPVDWAEVTKNQGKYNFIVAGSDTEVLRTGDYWSGARTFSVGPSIGLQPLKDGLKSTLAAIQTAVTDKIFGAKGLQNLGSLKELPLFGNTLQNATEALFLKDLSDKIEAKFTDKFKAAENASVDEIQEAFFELFEPTGLLKDSDGNGNITQEDVIYTANGSLVEFNFKLGGTKDFGLSLPSNIGLPQLGLKLGDTASFDLDYTFDAGFGIDTATNEFFFDTSPTEDLNISLKPTLPDATATIGFLQFKAEDIGSKLGFSVDLGDGNDNKLKSDELSNLTVTPEGSADIKLNLLSSINGSKGLPRIGADLNLNWDFIQGGLAPTVAFNNVKLDVGSFLSDFAGPVLENVQKITKPVQPVIDILTKEIDLKVFKLSLLDVAKKSGYINQPDIDFINSVANIVTIVNSIADIKKNSNIQIDLGSFNLGGADIRNPSFELSSVEEPNITSYADSPDTQLASTSNETEKTIITSLLKMPGGGLQFPFLTEPKEVFNLLLGKDIKLFTYDLPELKFDFDYSQFIPIVGPFGVRLRGNIGAGMDFAFGYDTTGLREFSSSKDATDIFNGLYVRDTAILPDGTETKDDIAEIFLNASLEASAELNVGVASAGVGGGIYGNIDFNLHDPDDDGKVYFNEVADLVKENPFSIFDTSGQITAGLNAYFKIGFKPFQIKKRYDSPRRILAEFNNSTEKQPILATKLSGSVLRLNMGPNAANRRNGNKTDQDETFTVTHKSGSSVNEKVLISAFDTKKEYNGVSKIVANGGEKNDIIELANNVLAPAELVGGNGDDLVTGGSGNDSLEGSSGLDLLNGRNGNDTLRGGADDDWLIGGAGADVIDGGLDNDTASYETATTSILLNLATGGATGDALKDVFVSIEQYEGSLYNDTLIGNDTGNLLGGQNGNDQLDGGKGSDGLDGGKGNDTLRGGADNDWLNGGEGADVLDGQEGYDVVSYATSTQGVLINLTTGEAAKDALGDVFTSIETIQGSPYEDTLIGDNNNNTLGGAGGNDVLEGADGDDVLVGGGGADTLRGGEGNDTYELNTKTDELNVQTAAGSRIQDTNGTDDTLKLSNITLSLSALASGQAGLARFDNTLLIDINQDGVANQNDDIAIDNFFLPREFSINDVTVTEGNSDTTNALFTVKGLAGTGGAGFIETVANLSGTDILNFLSTVTVDYAIVDGTATAGTDYNPTSSQLTFAQNETEKIVSVQVIGDTKVEPDETFFVNLSTASNTDIADLQGIVTILNDDLTSLPNVSFSNAPNSPFNVGSNPSSVAVGDLNADGLPDLTVANFTSSKVSVLLGDGTGIFGAATNFNTGSFPVDVAVGDLNADGLPDLAVANYSDNVSVLLGDGTGSFGAATNFNAGSYPVDVAVGDLNADGLPDLAVANAFSDNVSVLLGDGTGSFGAATNFNAGEGPTSVALGDLNADGLPDLAVANANASSKNVSVLLGDGTGSFGAATNFNAGSNPSSVAVGDLNADGLPDLAVANLISNNVSVLLGDGTGSFGAATNFNAGSNPSDVAVEDLNADGLPDLAVANYTSSYVSVLLGDGTGSFGAAANFNAGEGPTSVALGDFNKDGKPDLATRNNTSGDVSVLLNTTTLNAGIGGNNSATLTGSSSIGSNMIIGSNGDDILMGGLSGDIITGGTGSDQFFSESYKDFGDTITDFDPTSDVIGLNQIFASRSYGSSLPLNDYVQPIQIGSSTTAKIDPISNPAPDIFRTLVTLENVGNQRDFVG